ncbi:MAG: hypothetical protein ABL963_02190 [Longimicrobiales bacterium]
MTRATPSPWAVAGLYVFAAMLFASPLIDLFSTAWPPRVGDLSWRYGFMGLAAGYLQTPLLGLVLACAVAYWQNHSATLRMLGLLSIVAAVVLLPLLALWPMDVMQMRGLRAPEVQSGVAIGGAIQELKYLGAFLVTGILGLGCMRTASELSNTSRRQTPGIVSRG